MGVNGTSLIGQEAEKMTTTTIHPALWQCLHSTWGGVQVTHFYIDWIILAFKEAWPNEGDLLGYMGPWKSIK